MGATAIEREAESRSFDREVELVEEGLVEAAHQNVGARYSVQNPERCNTRSGTVVQPGRNHSEEERKDDDTRPPEIGKIRKIHGVDVTDYGRPGLSEYSVHGRELL